MTLNDLQHVFRHQTTATEDYTPQGLLEFQMIELGSRLILSHPADDLGGLIDLLENFQLDGYRDRMPIFVKPDVDL